MRWFGFLWIVVSILILSLGISMIVLPAMSFSLAPLYIAKLIMGIVLTISGAVALIVSIRLLILGRMKDALDKRKNHCGRWKK